MTDQPENQKDTKRAKFALQCLVDGRDLQKDYGSVLVTAEHAIAALLLTIMGGDPRKAAAILNPGIEERLGTYRKRKSVP